MNTIDPNKMFRRYEAMIHKLAWTHSILYRIPFDECYSVACYGFSLAIKRFRSGRGAKFGTYAHITIRYHLRDLLLGRVNDVPTVPMNEETHSIPAPPTRSPLLDAVDDLSEDAKEIVRLLIDTPAELLDQITDRPILHPKPIEAAHHLLFHIIEYLCFAGRSRKDLRNAYEELRLRFKEVWSTPSL